MFLIQKQTPPCQVQLHLANHPDCNEHHESMNQWIICSKFIGASSDRLPSVGWLMSSFQHSCTASTFAIKLNRIPIPRSELVNPGALHSQASDLRLLASNSQRHNKVWRSQSLPAAQCWAFPLPCAKHCGGCSAGTLATRNWWESVIRVIGLIRFACASMTRDERTDSVSFTKGLTSGASCRLGLRIAKSCPFLDTGT